MSEPALGAPLNGSSAVNASMALVAKEMFNDPEFPKQWHLACSLHFSYLQLWTDFQLLISFKLDILRPPGVFASQNYIDMSLRTQVLAIRALRLTIRGTEDRYINAYLVTGVCI